jgi:hypothetical protein
MGIKGDITKYALLAFAVVALAKPISNLVGQVGTSLGDAFSMGLSSFVSGITGGVFGSGSTPPTMPPANPTMPANMMMPMAPAENANQAILGGLATTLGQILTKLGTFDKFLMGGGSSTTTTTPDPNIGAKPIDSGTLADYFNMLTGKFSGITDKIPNIAQYLLDFLNMGGKSISDFASGFKFPSGLTLNEILGASGKGITPEAGAVIQMMVPMLIDPNSLYGGRREPRKDLPVVTSGLKSMPLPDMLLTMGLNMDKKIANPTDVNQTFTESQGKGSIIPNATEIIKKYGVSASEAENIKAMITMNYMGFDFGTNTGQALYDASNLSFGKTIRNDPAKLMMVEKMQSDLAAAAAVAKYGGSYFGSKQGFTYINAKGMMI